METTTATQPLVRLRVPQVGPATEAIDRARAAFARTQAQDGYWWGELESIDTMEAEFVLLTHFIVALDREREAKIAKDIRHRQSVDG